MLPSIFFSFLGFHRIREYCESESFRPRCGSNEVIVMETATYGRMRLGRCVTTDLGYLGCSSNVMSIADSRCSGRRQCQVRIPDPEMDATQPCFKELKIYLTASYACIPGKGTKTPLAPFGVLMGVLHAYLS